MVPVWLYSTAGVALYHVLAPDGASAVVYNGLTFCWSAVFNAYVQLTPVKVQAAPPAAHPEGQAVSPEALRAQLTQRLDALLGRWFLSAAQRSLLSSVRAYVLAMTEGELTKLCSFLPQTYAYGDEPCAT